MPIALNLILEVPKTQVLQGESIPFTVILTNTGDEAEEIRSLAFGNAAVMLTATDALGKSLTGDQHSFVEKQGEPHPHEKSPAMVNMTPGKTLRLSADVLGWLGELLPGEYTLVAGYSDSPALSATSNSVKVSIVPAAPSELFSTGDGARLSYAPRRVAWINRTAKGRDAYLLELDARATTESISNRPLGPFDGNGRVCVSDSNVDPAPVTYALWRTPANKLFISKMTGQGAPKTLDVPLPDAALQPMGQPFCDKDGGLAVLLVGPGGARGALLRIPPVGAAVSVPINFAPALSQYAAACWSRRDELLVVWTDAGRKAIYALNMPVAAANAPAARLIATAPKQISHLRVDSFLKQETSSFVDLATVLCHDDILDVFHRLRVNLAGGKIETAEQFKAPGSGMLQVFDSSMMQDGTIAYLLVDGKGQVHYGAPDLAKITPLEVRFQTPITRELSPLLVATGPLSRSRGFVLCFIRDGVWIERRLLK